MAKKKNSSNKNKKHAKAETAVHESQPDTHTKESAAQENAEEAITSEDGPTTVDGGEEVAEEAEVLQETGVDSPSSQDQGVQTEEKVSEGVSDDSRVKELEDEVSKLRLANDGVEQLQKELEQTKESKEKIQVQYDALLARIGSMKSVFTKMKEHELELEETKDQLEQYEKQNFQLKQKSQHFEKENSELSKTVELLKTEGHDLNAECDRLSAELRNLRSEYDSKDSGYTSEKSQLEGINRQLSSQLERLKQSNEEYIVTIENNKNVNMSLNNEITTLQDQISELNKVIKQLEADGESHLNERSQLQAKYEKLSNEFKVSSEKHVESLNALQTELQSSSDKYEELVNLNAKQRDDCARIPQLEQELKEKQLQIGKLRHEAVILNEHLTKALQLIKKNSASEQVDKELVTNLFISFLTIPRGDTKKFEVLQLISNYLGWNDEQKLQAGLSHNTSSRVNSRESFVSLWTEYLEKESS